MSAGPDPVCWKCGAALVDLSLPLARLAVCPACHSDLHVCRACVFFAREVANQCREPVADPVSDKTRSNFCGYFQWRPDAYRSGVPPVSARAALDVLFGGPSPTAEAVSGHSALDDLFGEKPTVK